MKLSEQVKSISFLKANAPDVIRDLEKRSQPLVITVHGEAKAVLQDILSYERTRETLALLKILALGNKDIDDGKIATAATAFARLRKRAQAD